jgi:lipopolysaccharide biosynthesis glycosyltransferase
LEAFPVFIGFDSREVNEFQVAKKSLIRRSSVPLHVQGLYREALEWPGDDSGIYTRAWYKDARDQWIDRIDGKPFSTEFSFSRFAVPILMQYRGWALFFDSDMVWQADLKDLLDFRDDKYAVMVVKHQHKAKEAVKMDGREQTNYFRKNWSSFILWNCGHPANRQLTRQTLNGEPGSWLHGFRWLRDDEIGSLPVKWNFLVGVNDARELPDGEQPCVLHYTLGTPEMPGYDDCQYSDVYWQEKHRPSSEYEFLRKRVWSEWDD